MIRNVVTIILLPLLAFALNYELAAYGHPVSLWLMRLLGVM